MARSYHSERDGQKLWSDIACSRHYGLFASVVRAQNIERARQLLAAAQSAPQRRRAEADSEAENILPTRRCPCCGGRMIVVETFEGVRPAQSPSPTRIGIDTS
jgi:hypothetical protein